jgi:hypothetical protein
MSSAEEDHRAYLACMTRIFRRFTLLFTCVNGQLGLGDENAASEYACLQLRNLLELIAFASLAANRNAYMQVRRGIANEWNATRILQNLEKVHPEFYPIAVTPTSGPPNWHFETVKDGALTKSEFELLYDRCSDGIHEYNPYREDQTIDLVFPPAEWAQKIWRLLEWHVIQLVDRSGILVVQLHDPVANVARIITAKRN